MLTSLRGKLILVFLTVIISAVSVSTFISHYIQKQFTYTRAEEIEGKNLKLISNEIIAALQEVVRDLYTLSEIPQVKTYFDNPDPLQKSKAISELQDFFTSFSHFHPRYHQVRLIDSTGLEQVRVNYENKKPVLVVGDQLQDKSDRYYFQQAIQLQKGEIYISPLDLNIEQGVIQRPFIPVIRYATPVTSPDERQRGLIVLNLFGNSLLKIIERLQGETRHIKENYYLLNSENYFLVHPNRTKTFGFMFGNEEKLSAYEPTLSEWMTGKDKGVVSLISEQTGKATFFSFQRISLEHSSPHQSFKEKKDIYSQKNHWILLSSVNESELLAGLDEYREIFFLYTLALFILCISAAVFVAWQVSRPVVSLATAARDIEGGDLSARAEVYTKDEMGQFGTLFNSMATNLEETVTSLQASEAKYRQLFENSRDCVFVTNTRCQLEDINAAGRTLLGLTPTQALPQFLPLSCCPSHAAGGENLETAMATTGYVENYQAVLQRPDGSERICLITATARRNPEGTVEGYEGVIRDITVERRREEAERAFQKQLREEILMAEERERRSLGQILHEELAQNLALLHLRIEETEISIQQIKEHSGEENQAPLTTLHQANQLIAKMIQQIRTMIFDLYPTILSEQGLVPAMKWYAEDFTKRIGIPVTVYELESHAVLSEPQRIYLYRAFKEILHNVFKHAEASEIVATVIGKEKNMRLIVDDDGKGFDSHTALKKPNKIKGIGLFTIKEWVESLQGSFVIESESGGGTRILIDIALQEEEKNTT